jgi:hypothetical protein
MFLFIYQPKDWLKITKLLNIKIFDLCKHIKNFYHSINKNNCNIETSIDFTAYINNKSPYHQEEYNLPAKIKLLHPDNIKYYFDNVNWSYRDLAYLTKLSYKTIYFYINNKGYMSFRITKIISDKLLN